MIEWHQETITLPAMPRGFHLITDRIEYGVPQLTEIEVGWLHLFLQHTSASLTINENADPDVPGDLETGVNHMCPELPSFVHTMEGADDMPAHVKSSTLGCSLTIPVSGGKLSLGVWQGIYLGEHRNRASSRRIVATLMGKEISYG